MEECGRFIQYQSPSGVQGTTATLKKYYENIFKNVRKNVTNEKASIKCTGGGEEGEGLFRKRLHCGLANKFDSDVSETPITENQNSSHSYGEFSDEENALDSETIIFQVEKEDTEEEVVNWRDFKVDHLRKPVNKKLIPKSQLAPPNDGNLTSGASSSKTPAKDNKSERDHSWTARRKPSAVALSSSDMSKKYNELAELKIQLVKNELEKCDSENRLEEERDTIELKLKKKSLSSAIQIKQVLLEKNKYASSSELVSFFKMKPARFYGSSKHVNTIPCDGSVSEDESVSDSDSDYVPSHYALRHGRSLIIPGTDNDSSDDGEENIENIPPLSRYPFDENNYKFIGVTELPVYIEELETPADFFLFLFPDDLISMIVEQSNMKDLQDNMNEPGSIIKTRWKNF
ncbi:hypothetical protein JTB14_007698 [Gonioctena quinquepunctata]|nr:hypothetical protein JTB14_007698 [Gonioctena quinquepunctata]